MNPADNFEAQQRFGVRIGVRWDEPNFFERQRIKAQGANIQRRVIDAAQSPFITVERNQAARHRGGAIDTSTLQIVERVATVAAELSIADSDRQIAKPKL